MINFQNWLQIVILGVTLPFCLWSGNHLRDRLSSPKQRHVPTSATVVLYKDRSNDPKKDIEVAMVDAQQQDTGDTARTPALLEGIKGNPYQEFQYTKSRIDAINALIARSNLISHLIESRVDTMRSWGIGQPEIKSHSDSEGLERERDIRETLTREIDRLLLDILAKYPEIKMADRETRASSSHLEEPVSLLCSEEVFALQHGHARSIKRARAKSAKRALHDRRIARRATYSTSTHRIPDISTTAEPTEDELVQRIAHPVKEWELPKASYIPTSSETVVFLKDNDEPESNEHLPLELEGGGKPSDIYNEGKATATDANPGRSPQVRLQILVPQVRLQILERVLEFNKTLLSEKEQAFFKRINRIGILGHIVPQNGPKNEGLRVWFFGAINTHKSVMLSKEIPRLYFKISLLESAKAKLQDEDQT